MRRLIETGQSARSSDPRQAVTAGRRPRSRGCWPTSTPLTNGARSDPQHTGQGPPGCPRFPCGPFAVCATSIRHMCSNSTIASPPFLNFKLRTPAGRDRWAPAQVSNTMPMAAINNCSKLGPLNGLGLAALRERAAVIGSIRQAVPVRAESLELQQTRLQQRHFRAWGDTDISGVRRSSL